MPHLHVQGVVFSVNYDPATRTVISTSDDRSVRTWKLETDGTLSATDHDLKELFWRGSVRPLHELYGHEARVWDSLVIRRDGNDPGLLASLGEDSRICLWQLDSGKLMSTIEAHPGSSVWAATWNSDANCLVCNKTLRIIQTSTVTFVNRYLPAVTVPLVRGTQIIWKKPRVAS